MRKPLAPAFSIGLAVLILGLQPLVSRAQTQPATTPATVPAARGGRGARGPAAPSYVSAEVLPDRRITFRLYAPQATSVRFASADIFNLGPRAQMTKGENGGAGIWETTVGPVDPGAYRYNFNLDGVSVLDPRNTSISESNINLWSLIVVPGNDLMDTKNVPHGAVASVTYFSKALNRNRRMHVYTPPGYETGSDKYPVFYLLHGAQDCDDSWTSVGRAGFIMDNLIAAGKAKPMVIVMPAGHTTASNNVAGLGRGRGSRGADGGAGGPAPRDEFLDDFRRDIRPYAESHYRLVNDRQHRAIAGLSMGGMQTLNVAFADLKDFAYIGVFSSGTLGDATAWETAHAAALDDAALKPDVKLLWFSTGSQDNLITNTRATVDLLKKHGFAPVFKESTGAHTWLNWRNYLIEFAPQLFQ